jgi:hypothetical protein
VFIFEKLLNFANQQLLESWVALKLSVSLQERTQFTECHFVHLNFFQLFDFIAVYQTI